jgi:hypothetical protein
MAAMLPALLTNTRLTEFLVTKLVQEVYVLVAAVKDTMDSAERNSHSVETAL